MKTLVADMLDYMEREVDYAIAQELAREVCDRCGLTECDCAGYYTDLTGM